MNRVVQDVQGVGVLSTNEADLLHRSQAVQGIVQA